MLYERPVPLKGDVLKQRIFSPLAYENVRNANVIAITAQEAMRYASHFPIAWHRHENRFELIIVRSLLADGRGHPAASQSALPFLPALCRAYPFMYEPGMYQPGRHEPSRHFIDVAVADAPTDVGSPICFSDGRPAKATAQRIALLDIAAPMFAETAQIAGQLSELALFEAWPLHFENIEGYTLDVADLWIVKQDAISTGALAPVLRRHGIVAADLIALHRLSLFRTGIMLANARAALRAAPASSAPASEAPGAMAEQQS